MEWSRFNQQIWLNLEGEAFNRYGNESVWILTSSSRLSSPVHCMLHTSVHICQLKRTHSSRAWEAVAVILTVTKSIQKCQNLHSLTRWNKDTRCASFHCKWYFVLFRDYSAYQKGRMCPSLSIFLICIRSAMVSRWSFVADMWSTVSGKAALNVTRMNSFLSNNLNYKFTVSRGKFGHPICVFLFSILQFHNI